MVPPDQLPRKYHKKERSKSSEVHDNIEFGSNGHISSTKITTENSSEVSVDIPETSYMRMPFSTNTKFSQDEYYFFGMYIIKYSPDALYIISKKHEERSCRDQMSIIQGRQ